MYLNQFAYVAACAIAYAKLMPLYAERYSRTCDQNTSFHFAYAVTYAVAYATLRRSLRGVKRTNEIDNVT